MVKEADWVTDSLGLTLLVIVGVKEADCVTDTLWLTL